MVWCESHSVDGHIGEGCCFCLFVCMGCGCGGKRMKCRVGGGNKVREGKVY